MSPTDEELKDLLEAAFACEDKVTANAVSELQRWRTGEGPKCVACAEPRDVELVCHTARCGGV